MCIAPETPLSPAYWRSRVASTKCRPRDTCARGKNSRRAGRQGGMSSESHDGSTRRRLHPGRRCRARGGERARCRPRAAAREPQHDRLDAGDRGELRRHVPHGGGQARARHAVRRPRRHAEGGEHRRVRPRRRAAPSWAAASSRCASGSRRRAFGGGGVGLFESIETADTDRADGLPDRRSPRSPNRGQERPRALAGRGVPRSSPSTGRSRASRRRALGGTAADLHRPQLRAVVDPAPSRGMIAALEGAGIGFGRQGAAPGQVLRVPRRSGPRRRRT